MANRIGAVIIDVQSDVSHLVEGMKKAEGIVEGSTKVMLNAVKVLAAAYSVVSLKNLIDETAQLTVEQKSFAEQLSISTTALSTFEYVASKAHVSTDAMRDAFKDAGTKVTEFQRDGESAKEAFKALGISQDFAKEKMYTTERSMNILLQRLAEFPDGMQKATIAQEIFGDEGAKVIRVANLGADAIKKYTDEAIRGNIATSEAFAQKSASYTEAQNRLEALEGGWASAVIEESHFLEMGSNMYKMLGDSVLEWTEDVQDGNSTFVDGLDSIATGVNAVFPTVIEISGIVASSFVTVGSAVVDVAGVVVELVADLFGLDTQANSNITVLGHFAGFAMGATMAVENFASLVKLSANGLEYFGSAISTYAISRLEYLQSKFYASMATISDFLSFLDDDYENSAKEYEKKSLQLENKMLSSLSEGNSKFAALAKERSEILANIHSAEYIQAKMEATAMEVSYRQKKAFKENEEKLKNKNYDKQGKESVKQLEKTMKALDKAKNKQVSLSKSTVAHTKALKSEARELKNVEKAQNDRFSAWERETNEQQKQLESKYQAEKKYLKLTGKLKELEALEFKELMFELREDGLEESKLAEVYESELKKMNHLNMQFIEDFRYGLSGVFSDVFAGANMGDSLKGMLDSFSKNSLNDFADTLSDKISKGITDGFKTSDFSIFKEDGTMSDFGTQATVAGVNLLDNMLNDDTDLNGPEKEGAIIGEAAGSAIGYYLGGPLGASIGGSIGEYAGNKIGGFLFGGDKNYYVDIGADGEAHSMGHRSGGLLRSGKIWEIEEESIKLNKELEKAFTQYGELLDFIAPSFEGILQLDAGHYADAEAVFNEALPKEFFTAWIDGVESVADDAMESMDMGTLQNSLGNMFGSTVSAMNATIDEMRVDELYDAWKDYAEGIDETVNEALFEVLGNLKSKSISIDEYNLRGDNEALLNYRINLLREQELALEDKLGLGDVTLENYNEKLDELKNNGATPEEINNFIALGDTLMGVSENSDALTKHLSDLENAQVNASNALAEANRKLTDSANANRSSFADWHNTLGMNDGELYSYTLMRARQELESSANLLGVSGVTATNYIDNFNAAINSGMTEDALSNWEQLGDNIRNVVDLQQQKWDEESNYIKKITNSYKTEFQLIGDLKKTFMKSGSTTDADSYLALAKSRATTREEYRFAVNEVKGRLLKETTVQTQPKFNANGAMKIESESTDKKIEDLTMQVKALAEDSKNNSKDEVAELRKVIETLQEQIKQSARDSTGLVRATRIAKGA